MDLLQIRKQIDEIDNQVVELFEKRMELCKDVATYKIEVGKEVFDAKREDEKLEKLSGMAHESFNKKGIQELYKQIMAMSRKLQYRLIGQYGKQEPSIFRLVKTLPMQKKKVVFQGVEGAYSFTAMHSFLENPLIILM